MKWRSCKMTVNYFIIDFNWKNIDLSKLQCKYENLNIFVCYIHYLHIAYISANKTKKQERGERKK